MKTLAFAFGMLIAQVCTAQSFTIAQSDPTPVAIPDGASPSGFGAAATKTVPFFSVQGDVVGITVGVQIAHPWAGDVDLVVESPIGTTFTLVSRCGAFAAADDGYSAQFNGFYTFTDNPTTGSGDLWAAAAAAGTGTIADAQHWRTSFAGGGGGPSGVATNMNPAFAGMSSGNANGTWIVRARDWAAVATGQIGQVTIAIQYVTPPPNDGGGGKDKDDGGCVGTGGTILAPLVGVLVATALQRRRRRDQK